MCVCISFLHEPAECFPRPIIEGQFTGSECRDHVSCKSPLQSGIEHEEREEGVGGAPVVTFPLTITAWVRSHIYCCCGSAIAWPG